MSRLTLLSLLLAVLLATSAYARSLSQNDDNTGNTQCTTVDWIVPSDGQQFPAVTIPEGGCVTLVWTGFHGVVRLNEANCALLGNQSNESEVLVEPVQSSSFTFRPTGEEEEEYYLACPVDGHCPQGQLLPVIVGTGGTEETGGDAGGGGY